MDAANTSTPLRKTQRPAFADSQGQQILALLREAGPRGVRKEDLLYTHRWSQTAARICELEERGCKIRHDFRPGEKFVVYVLESEPLELKPIRPTRDWIRERIPTDSQGVPLCQSDAGPLFATSGGAA